MIQHLRRLFENMDPRALGILIALLLGIGLLWDTWAVYPLKILVVFFHELSHGLAAIFTGGSISHIELSAQQGGVCYTRGGSRFLTLTAGYLGSLLWGGLILLTAARTRLDRYISGGLGVLIILIGLLFLRPLFSFGFGFVAIAGIGFMGLGFFASERINDMLLRTVGLTSILYAPLDIKSDILDRPHLRSDAVMLAEHTHIPSTVWGILWITVAAIAAAYFLLQATQREVTTPATP